MKPSQRVEINRLNGLNAERIVADRYTRQGFECVAQRFRTRAGEIDLIFRHGEKYYFTEVKRANDHDTAMGYLNPYQIERMKNVVCEFLNQNDLPLETDMRFDAALVDKYQRVKVIPNILH